MSLLILVVDDEPDVEVLFRQRFRRDLRAGRFTMSLRNLVRTHFSASVVLLAYKALRPDVPVIMITAYGDAATKRKALENGAEALLTKPIDFATLRNGCASRLHGRTVGPDGALTGFAPVSD